MAEVLAGPVVDPEGVHYGAGAHVPSSWPDWFVADLRTLRAISHGKTPARNAAAKQAPRVPRSKQRIR